MMKNLHIIIVSIIALMLGYLIGTRARQTVNQGGDESQVVINVSNTEDSVMNENKESRPILTPPPLP